MVIEIPILPQELKKIVQPFATSIMKRVATAIALVMFIAALPVAGVCCVAKPACKMAGMRASMPCCAGTCTIRGSNPGLDRDATLTTAPSRLSGADSSVAVPVLPIAAAIVATTTEPAASGFAAPDPVLLNAQFRI